ncbi:MAG: hypothetical protein LBF54_03520 [Holosporaceae bacterium]|jgi:septal ring factor EnvC (AmiA/AmiB activator)|nr:hypothetical protein [Holosporaceae bacterium]
MKKNFLKMTALVLCCAFLGNEARAMNFSPDEKTVLSSMIAGDYFLAMQAVCDANIELNADTNKDELMALFAQKGISDATYNSLQDDDSLFEKLVQVLAATRDSTDSRHGARLLAYQKEMDWNTRLLRSREAELAALDSSLAGMKVDCANRLGAWHRDLAAAEKDLALRTRNLASLKRELERAEISLRSVQNALQLNEDRIREIRFSWGALSYKIIRPAENAVLAAVPRSFATFQEDTLRDFNEAWALLEKDPVRFQGDITPHLRATANSQSVEIARLRALLEDKQTSLNQLKAAMDSEQAAHEADLEDKMEKIRAVLASLNP